MSVDFALRKSAFNASDRLQFFQASASGRPPGPVVVRRQKPAKNDEKANSCRKKHLHFSADSEVLCRRPNACIGCNGPAHSRFSSPGLIKATMSYLDLKHAQVTPPSTESRSRNCRGKCVRSRHLLPPAAIPWAQPW